MSLHFFFGLEVIKINDFTVEIYIISYMPGFTFFSLSLWNGCFFSFQYVFLFYNNMHSRRILTRECGVLVIKLKTKYLCLYTNFEIVVFIWCCIKYVLQFLSLLRFKIYLFLKINSKSGYWLIKYVMTND